MTIVDCGGIELAQVGFLWLYIVCLYTVDTKFRLAMLLFLAMKLSSV